MKVFFDLEFTGLHQKTTLISMGCIAQDGRQFYAESKDYDRKQITPWLQRNVVDHLYLQENVVGSDLPTMTQSPRLWTIIGHDQQIKTFFMEWVKDYESVEMWGDCLAYDWVLFCELFPAADLAERLPSNIYYIPFDICTLLYAKGIDPDVDRQAFAQMTAHVKHNSLDDARVIRLCWERLVGREIASIK